MNASPYTNKRLFATLGIILSLLIGIAAVVYYTDQKKGITREKSNELETISKLKTEQIVNWHNERLADASVLIQNPFF